MSADREAERLRRRLHDLGAVNERLRHQLKDLRRSGTQLHQRTLETLKAETARADAAERRERDMRSELDGIRRRLRDGQKAAA